MRNFEFQSRAGKRPNRQFEFAVRNFAIGFIMIQMQTSLEVADNSGARRVEMIMGIGGATGAIAGLGDRIKVTVKEALA